MVKKTKKTSLNIGNNNTQEVLEGEVVSGEDINRGHGKIKFNDEVQVISGFYERQQGKVIGRKKIVLGEKLGFIYQVLLDSIDLIEVYEQELRVLSDNN